MGPVLTKPPAVIGRCCASNSALAAEPVAMPFCCAGIHGAAASRSSAAHAHGAAFAERETGLRTRFNCGPGNRNPCLSQPSIGQRPHLLASRAQWGYSTLYNPGGAVCSGPDCLTAKPPNPSSRKALRSAPAPLGPLPSCRPLDRRGPDRSAASGPSEPAPRPAATRR